MNAVLFLLSILIGEVTRQVLAARPVPQPVPLLANCRPLALPEGADDDTLVILIKFSAAAPQPTPQIPAHLTLPRSAGDLNRDKYARQAWAALDANGVFHADFLAVPA